METKRTIRGIPYQALLLKKIDVFGCAVMPGPQLKQAIPFTRQIHEQFPDVKIVWGGYLASKQCDVVLNSGCVYYVVNGMGDITFPKLIEAIKNNETVADIKNLIYLKEGKVVKTGKDHIPNLDELPGLPYKDLDERYSIKGYLTKTFMGEKTLSYHSSFGCPFTCSFFAVVTIYNARWKGMYAKRIREDINWFKD
jgi:anaerobic magnesium-protoporphyrin IX monomethyl ester cyclase